MMCFTVYCSAQSEVLAKVLYTEGIVFEINLDPEDAGGIHSAYETNDPIAFLKQKFNTSHVLKHEVGPGEWV